MGTNTKNSRSRAARWAKLGLTWRESERWGRAYTVLFHDNVIVGAVHTRLPEDPQWAPIQVPRGLWRGWVCIPTEHDVYSWDNCPDSIVMTARIRSVVMAAVADAWINRTCAVSEALLRRLDGEPTDRDKEQEARGW